MPTPYIIPIQKAWARNAVNAVIFRKNAVATHAGWQYTAFYDETGAMLLAKRRLDSTYWDIQKTQYSGNVNDAHNVISLAIDGDGFLHLAWDHHNHPLRYCRSLQPESLALTDKLAMTGQFEERVTYPEFHNLPDGGLFFLYRDGQSGNGNLMLNRYNRQTKSWTAVQQNLIDGQGERNAYPNQLTVDQQGGLHLSWCWRESPDVATNHDICYAKSLDGGHTWLTSTGQPYTLPITIDNAEIIWPVPQAHELINQTSMTVDGQGRPMIATYWRQPDSDVPQYHLIYHDGQGWRASQVGQRQTPFRLGGAGSKAVPISRPMVLASDDDQVFMVFRDSERGGCVSIACSQDGDKTQWNVLDLTEDDVGFWEPAYDTALWQQQGVLHLFLQKVGQGDGETLEDVPPQMASILEWTPPKPSA